MTRCTASLLGAVLLAACGSGEDPAAAAAVFVAGDLAVQAPEGLTPYVVTRWQIVSSAELEPIPTGTLLEMVRVSGLPAASEALMARRDSTVVVLYMLRPIVIRPDSILVAAGWMGFSGGDGGGFWAHEYDYRLDCRRSCRLLAPPGMAVLN